MYMCMTTSLEYIYFLFFVLLIIIYQYDEFESKFGDLFFLLSLTSAFSITFTNRSGRFSDSGCSLIAGVGFNLLLIIRGSSACIN
ncbi:hypothetical protein N665_0352s0014 [Sinapis alba]|nr:hypothetical protein N665_0352s0014 [Sinapis alba]